MATIKVNAASLGVKIHNAIKSQLASSEQDHPSNQQRLARLRELETMCEFAKDVHNGMDNEITIQLSTDDVSLLQSYSSNSGTQSLME
ncbi:MAG: hypothetical protein DRQ39_07220 [Gammaproteobacteria bacterium]|nr:MAG: hypothetical protein DRQ39_07220 [Gammaproteobacteria bacterium]